MAKVFNRLTNVSKRGRAWQIFGAIMLLLIAGLLVDAGSYYNKGTDWIAGKTGHAIVLPKTKEIPFRLGLDLQGGTQLAYKADISKLEGKDQETAVEGARDVIERRVNTFGVSEPRVETNRTANGEYQLIVELAGIKDVDEAIKMIGETPLLEFKEPSDEPEKLSDEQQKEISDYNKQAEKRAEEVLGKALKGGDFSELAKQYSEDDATKSAGGEAGFIAESANPELVGIAKKIQIGKISNLEKTSRGYEIVKYLGKREKTNAFNESEKEMEVRASHILICHKDAEGCTSDRSKDDALKLIKDLEKQAKPATFKELARRYSDDTGSKDNGGELGWFSKGQMVEPFEKAVYEQKKGTISYIVESKFGYHLILKEDERAVVEYNLATILIKTKSAQDFKEGEINWKNTELTGKNLKSSSVQFDPNDNTPQVSLEFDEEGAKLFEEITRRNVNKQVAIFLDNYVISAPTVNEAITGGKAVISGRFNIKEAKLLAQRLNTGALPVPITLISQQTVGASLGKAAVDASIKAGLIGLGLVALFMIVIYRLPGLVSVLSLCAYGVLVLAIFKLWPVTLTLPGLAGFIMTIGVAVDANVLIFARLKEEIKTGKPLGLALDEAFRRAWPSIRDGNFSTLITCFILYQFTTSMVKGFSITLALGILISLFSGIIITRNFLTLIYGDWLEKRPWLLGVKK